METMEASTVATIARHKLSIQCITLALAEDIPDKEMQDFFVGAQTPNQPTCRKSSGNKIALVQFSVFLWRVPSTTPLAATISGAYPLLEQRGRSESFTVGIMHYLLRLET